MNNLQDTSSEALAANLHRKLGRCILRLQQYEQLLKRIVAHQDVSLVADKKRHWKQDRSEEVERKTLGQVVGNLTGSFLTTTADYLEKKQEDDTEELDLSKAHIRSHFSLVMSEENYQNTTKTLAELVGLRNDLVHHFLERFDLTNESGWDDAERYLDQAYQTVDERFRELRDWAELLVDLRKKAGALVNTPEFKAALIYGVVPGQDVNWPATTIIHQLHAAEQECSEGGWTNLKRAKEYIWPKWPNLTPKIYGCSSWRHVIHESGLFYIEKRENPKENGRSVWYRSKLTGAKDL